MKKTKLLLKSLYGIPLGIFTLEIINLIISVEQKTYFRMDEFNLRNVILQYTFCSIYSYIMMLFLNINKEIKNEDISFIEQEKKSVKLVPLVLIIVISMILWILCFTIVEEHKHIGIQIVLGMSSPMLWPSLYMGIESIKYLINLVNVELINNKLKKRK